MSAEFFLEIGTEEIPARFIPPALESLAAILRERLEAERVGFGAVRTLGSPRRLVAVVSEVAASQRDEESLRVGPSIQAAYDDEGRPTKAAEGFARSQGVSVEDLVTEETDKGKYVAAPKRQKGRPTPDVLSEILPGIILSIPFPKSMRWAELDIRFARPIHWIAALFGGKAVPFTVGEVRSGNKSRGNRYTSPEEFKVKGFDDYAAAMKKRGLIVDQDARRELIKAQAEEAAQKVGGRIHKDDDLLDQVTFLTESPFAVVCSFDKKYMELPADVLITVMKSHQKYFSVEDEKGGLLPRFVAVADIHPRDPDVVARGNEKVLHARLEDALFFFREDAATSLENYVKDLKGVVFQKKLGTYFDKTERIVKLNEFLANRYSVGEKGRAALLCKADLVTSMVYEFPELQGKMGREYALKSGEGEDVARAIDEHYMPRFAGDALPSTRTGAVVAIADKIDTIVGCFSVGLGPTGAGDPYALRRQALGLIAILQDREWPQDLSDLVDRALEALGDRIKGEPAAVRAEVMEFFRGRLYNMYLSKGYPHEVVEAVLSAGFGEVNDLDLRIRAVGEFFEQPDFEPLAISFKRVVNILVGESEGEPDPDRLEEPQEKALHKEFQHVRDRVDAMRKNKDYELALQEITSLKGSIDDFFDHVLVMTEDEHLKNNRLALLSAIARTYKNIADFRKFSV